MKMDAVDRSAGWMIKIAAAGALFVGASGASAASPQGVKPAFFGTCTGLGPGAFVGANNCNVVLGKDGGIVSGTNNSAYAQFAAIVGGNTNTIWAGDDSFIGGGNANAIGGFEVAVNTYGSAIVGGDSNLVRSAYATIGGGFRNTVSADFGNVGGGTLNYLLGRNSTIAGGYGNTINAGTFVAGNAAADAVIAGGANNTISAAGANAGYWGAIGGGSHNVVTGVAATVPGGAQNTAAGAGSFAAGTNAYAKHDGSFVFSDAAANGRQLVTLAPDEFLVRASGGVAFFSNAALTSGVKLSPGSGTWASLSDRDAKRNIVALDPRTVLEKVAALPVSTWSYRTEAAGVRHVGPMAQDFYAAFRVGEDDRHITTVDEDGVALAAIKGLYEKNAALGADVRRKAAHLSALQSAVERLTERDTRLEAEVAALTARINEKR